MPHVFQFHPNANMIIQDIELDFCSGDLVLLYLLFLYQDEQLSCLFTDLSMCIYFNIVY